MLHFDVCRLCLIKENVSVNIFEETSKELYLKIIACLPITVSKEDKLPKKICPDCRIKVNNFYEFWQNTFECQKQLSEWFNVASSFNPQDKNDSISFVNLNELCEAEMIETRKKSKRTAAESDVMDVTTVNDSANNEVSGDEDGEEGEEDDSLGSKSAKSSEDQNSSECASFSYGDSELGPSGFQNNSSSNFSSFYDKTRCPDGENSFGNLPNLFRVLGEMEPCTASYHHTQYEEKRLESPFKCDVCGKIFSCEDILAMHRLSQCGMPGETRRLVGSMESVLRDEEPSSSGANNSVLHQQQQQQQSKDGAVIKFGCEECGREFATLQHLKSHQTCHSEAKPFSCQKCGTAFRYKKTFETHVKIHANESATLERCFVCDVCEQRFTTRNSYIHHARSHKGMAGNKCKLMCFVCNETFASKRMLAHHLRQQCGDRSAHICQTCGKELLTKESLDCHKLIHEGAAGKSLVCKVCDKRFSHRKYFVVHQRIHTGERPYKCVTCEKTFTQASTLTVHRRYHTGERPYKCGVCAKGFVTRTIMMSHLKYHKEENGSGDGGIV